MNACIDMNSDSIGETVFSKHWLYKCLLKTIELLNSESKYIDKQKSEDIDKSEDNQNSESVLCEKIESLKTIDSNNETLIELDSESEEQLSILWQMSANEEVIIFLNSINAIQLFQDIIITTNSPRFAEISAGILANIANNHSICITLSNKQGFRDLILSSLNSSDIPFIIQLIRLINTSLANTEVNLLWIESIKSNSSQFFSTIQYILDNCLNCDLLKALFVLINRILYIDDSVGIQWLQNDRQNNCLKCLLQASNQLISEDIQNIQSLDYLWLILHSFSLSNQQFFSSYIQLSKDEIVVLFKNYIISSFGDSNDYIISNQTKAGSLSASISLFNQIISSLSLKSQKTFSNDIQLIDCLNKLLINCDQSLPQMSSNSESFQLALDQLKAIIELMSHINSRTIDDS